MQQRNPTPPAVDRATYRSQLTEARNDITLIRDSQCPFCLGEYTRASLDGNHVTGRHWRHDRSCLAAPKPAPLPAWAQP